VTNWSEVPEEFRMANVRIGQRHSRGHDAAAGTFEIELPEPLWQHERAFFVSRRIGGELEVAGLQVREHEDRIDVAFPQRDLGIRVTVHPRFGGKVDLFFISTFHPSLGTSIITPQSLAPDLDGRFLLARSGGPIRVQLQETEPRTGVAMHRGWFEFGEDPPRSITLNPGGRWVEFDLESAGESSIQVQPMGLLEDQYSPFSTYMIAKTQHLWIPEGTRFVRVSHSSGMTRTDIPPDELGDRYVIR
jgi:hypothetical protein